MRQRPGGIFQINLPLLSMLKQLKRMQVEKDFKADEYNAIAAGILALKEKIGRQYAERHSTDDRKAQG